jgi:hypothetical protein
MISKSRTVLWVGVAAVGISIAVLFAADQMYIDSCLDSGGSIDYDAFRCDLGRSHPARSYLESRWQRYLIPLAGLAGWIILSGLVAKHEQNTDD